LALKEKGLRQQLIEQVLHRQLFSIGPERKGIETEQLGLVLTEGCSVLALKEKGLRPIRHPLSYL